MDRSVNWAMMSPAAGQRASWRRCMPHEPRQPGMNRSSAAEDDSSCFVWRLTRAGGEYCVRCGGLDFRSRSFLPLTSTAAIRRPEAERWLATAFWVCCRRGDDRQHAAGAPALAGVLQRSRRRVLDRPGSSGSGSAPKGQTVAARRCEHSMGSHSLDSLTPTSSSSSSRSIRTSPLRTLRNGGTPCDVYFAAPRRAGLCPSAWSRLSC